MAQSHSPYFFLVNCTKDVRSIFPYGGKQTEALSIMHCIGPLLFIQQQPGLLLLNEVESGKMAGVCSCIHVLAHAVQTRSACYTAAEFRKGDLAP